MLPAQPKNVNIESDLLRGEVIEGDEESTIAGTKVDQKDTSYIDKFRTYVLRGVTMDVANIQGNNLELKGIHDVPTKYDKKTEYLYSLLQVCTAMFASFAHGSNDIANAIGPISAIYAIWSTGTFGTNTAVPIWLLVYGAVALNLGLTLFGFHVMQNLGNNLTYHSPSRGFSMEMGAAITVVCASFLGLPVSTTHCITGATIGVGLCSGSVKAINWKMVSWTMFSWLVTVPVVATVAYTLMILLISAPHVQ